VLKFIAANVQVPAIEHILTRLGLQARALQHAAAAGQIPLHAA
jgi:hypothetical protein